MPSDGYMKKVQEGEGGTLGTLMGQGGRAPPKGGGRGLLAPWLGWKGDKDREPSPEPVLVTRPFHTPEAPSSHAGFSLSSRVGKL